MAGGAGAPCHGQLQLEVAGGGPVRGAVRGAAGGGEPAQVPGRAPEAHHQDRGHLARETINTVTL